MVDAIPPSPDAPSRPGAAPDLPPSRGPLTELLFEALARDVHTLRWESLPIDSVSADDLHLALYCAYELHYQGFTGVDPEWEWEPSLLAFRRRLEARFERSLRRVVGPVDIRPEEVVARLWEVATTPRGPSLSAWVEERAEHWHVRELAKQRSAYQLKEADPHTWAVPRLAGQAKAVMVAIQADEYGGGHPSSMHATLFAQTMALLGLDPTPHRYLSELPGVTLATTNLISLFGLHRRWRGSLVGHLALFEMTSVGPMARYARSLRRLGVDERACRFYDVHVEADEVHQELAADGMVAGLLEADPGLAAQVLFGALALTELEARFTRHVLDRWESGRSSLVSPLRVDGAVGTGRAEAEGEIRMLPLG